MLNIIQIRYSDCEPITWIIPLKDIQIDPLANIMAIIINIVDNQGAIRIFKKDNDKYMNNVGIEKAGNLVIIL